MTRVACQQLAPVLGDLEANRAMCLGAIDEAADAGADVVVLPELITCGYMFSSADEAAGVAIDPDHELLREWGSVGPVVVGGFAERGADGAVYNSAAVVDGSGVRAVYRKLHLWDNEQTIFTPGESPPPVVETSAGRIGAVICYDLEFPELTRSVALAGAQLLAVPTNWPLFDRPKGEPRASEVVIAMATARINRIAIACADRLGVERGQEWTGGTAIVGVDGWVAAEIHEPGLIVADVDLDAATDKKLTDRADVFGDRRPDLLRAGDGMTPMYLKQPSGGSGGGRGDSAVSERVSEMLRAIERGGLDAVRRYSRELDHWDPPAFGVTDEQISAASNSLPDALKESIAFAQTQIRGFAQLQRDTLTDFEVETLPGVFLGQRQVPVAAVGAYCPSGRVPMLAAPFMTVLVPKVAGVGTVIACTPPRGGELHAPTLHSIATSGADRIFALGGVQALAAMAFGLLADEGAPAVDMIVGPGNAFVAEAKRQLFGRVGIDLLAGPSEVTVIADDTADPELVAADLLAQAEHGPTSPAVLITTSESFGRTVIEEIGHHLDQLDRSDHGAPGDPAGATPRAAWSDYGTVVVASDREEAVALSDEVAPEHLEVQTADDAWYHARLRNYGSVFLGSRATVAFSDKAIGTNHTLPTGRAARYTGGLSVAKFLKTLTYQRIDTDEGVRAIAPHVAEISRADLMPAHEATATKRLERFGG